MKIEVEEKLYEIITARNIEVIEITVNYKINSLVMQFRQFYTTDGRLIGKIKL